MFPITILPCPSNSPGQHGGWPRSHFMDEGLMLKVTWPTHRGRSHGQHTGEGEHWPSTPWPVPFLSPPGANDMLTRGGLWYHSFLASYALLTNRYLFSKGAIDPKDSFKGALVGKGQESLRKEELADPCSLSRAAHHPGFMTPVALWSWDKQTSFLLFLIFHGCHGADFRYLSHEEGLEPHSGSFLDF